MAKRRSRKITNPTTRRKMSEAHKGSKNGMYGKKHSAETKNKIKNSLIRYWLSIPKSAEAGFER